MQIVSVNMPDIGEGVVEGEIIEWLKQVNDPVKEHEPVVVVMTDKATVELPSPYTGKLVKQYYKVGQTAIKDKPLYDVETEATILVESENQKKVPLKQFQKPSVPSPQPVKRSENKALAAPPTRKLAKDLGIDINTIAGTGPDGLVTKEDLTQFHLEHRSTSTRASPDIHHSTPVLHWDDDEEFPIMGLRKIVAEKMVESKLIIPHFSYFDQMDATRLVQMRENIKQEAEKQGIKLTYMPFLIRALSLTIKKFPTINASVDLAENMLIVHKHQNIGIAFKTPSGLIAPVFKNVQDMTLTDIIKNYHAFKEKASANKLEPSDMKESTITISNFGTLGGLWATPIINYPEVAILGVAKIHKEPVVVNDAVAVREMLNLSWSFDHRIIDGDSAAQVSNYLITLLKNPASLL